MQPTLQGQPSIQLPPNLFRHTTQSRPTTHTSRSTNPTRSRRLLLASASFCSSLLLHLSSTSSPVDVNIVLGLFFSLSLSFHSHLRNRHSFRSITLLRLLQSYSILLSTRFDPILLRTNPISILLSKTHSTPITFSHSCQIQRTLFSTHTSSYLYSIITSIHICRILGTTLAPAKTTVLRHYWKLSRHPRRKQQLEA